MGVLLASFSLGSHGRSCCFLQSVAAPLGISSRPKPPIRGGYHAEYHGDCASYRSASTLAYSNRQPLRQHRAIGCHTNNSRSPRLYANRRDDDEAEESSGQKRGVFKKIREKISSAFSGSKRGEDDEVEGPADAEIGYKPNALDAIRLRLAMAMSGLSKNLFQSSEDWVVACPKTKVGPGQIIPCTVNGLDIIIFASRDGQRLDAFANACPHLGSPFDLATVERKPVIQDKGRKDDGTGDGCVDCIVCPVHRTAFEIQSGQVRGDWCPYPPVIGGIM